jgi:hypothetical protein
LNVADEDILNCRRNQTTIEIDHCFWRDDRDDDQGGVPIDAAEALL